MKGRFILDHISEISICGHLVPLKKKKEKEKRRNGLGTKIPFKDIPPITYFFQPDPIS
jgi:hypothetical protein